MNATTDTTTSATADGTRDIAQCETERRRRYWIDDWRPEDPVFWAQTGARVARRNLVYSVFSEHIGFSIWSLWSVMVLFLGPAYHVDAAGKFVLTAVPTLIGSALRLPYSLLVTKIGGRNWTVISALLLLVPSIFAAIVMRPGASYTSLLLAAAIAGVGGGNFASSMTNVNAYYPQRLKGRALGINAGGGNLGVAVMQLVALAVLLSVGAGHPRIVVGIYIPLIAVATILSALFMNNLAHVTNNRRAMREVCRDKNTWIISLLYIGTFGSFIGFGFALGQVLQVQFKADFPTPLKAAEITFLGPLIGSLIRPLGGVLADRIGGARVTFVNFVAMAVSASVVLIASHRHSLVLFFAGFMLLFAFSGIGSGSTYKMIPAIFAAKARMAAAGGAGVLDALGADRAAARLAGALIGVAGAIGAFGGVLVNLAFRESFLRYGTGNGAYVAFIAFYGLCFAVTWVVYLRRSPHRLERV